MFVFFGMLFGWGVLFLVSILGGGGLFSEWVF